MLGQIPGGNAYYSLENHPSAITHPGLLIVRFDGPLFFATATSLRQRIRELTVGVEPPIQALILDMESTNIIDLQGSEELVEVVQELKEMEIVFYLARVKVKIKEIMVKDGVLETIPESSFFTSVESAVEAWRNRSGNPDA